MREREEGSGREGGGKGGGGNLSFEGKEVEKEEKVKEQRERRQLQSVFCFSQDNYSSQVTQFGRALRKTVRKTIGKKYNQIIHFKENK